MEKNKVIPVYLRDDEHCWIPALQLKTYEGKATVSCPKLKGEKDMLFCPKPSKKVRYLSNKVVALSEHPGGMLPIQNVDANGELEEYKDMVDLPFMHEASILYNLKLRHAREKPYTRTADILIACNPYKWLNELYTEEKRSYYSNRLVWDLPDEDPRMQMEPHVYEVSALSYKGLAFGMQQDQSILVSGESGSGKTETVKICLNHIASVQRGQCAPGCFDDDEPVVRRVLESNPLLEAFGNAKTTRNENSSRFGKYLQLQFARDVHPAPGALKSSLCGLVGSKCDVYLLEKNRVVRHDQDERSFHIFYQLLAIADDDKAKFWEGLRGTTKASFKYVGHCSTDCIEGVHDRDRFQETLDALKIVGVVGEKLQTLIRAICITMQLGNLEFGHVDGDVDRSEIVSKPELKALALLTGIAESDLVAAFTQRTFKTTKETHKVPLNGDSAKEACDALAKEIYQKTFLWLVDTINKSTSPKQIDGKETCGLIGLLDIFGFEAFTLNRFEQLLINYANEKLQQKFTQDIFENVMAEYKSEGINLDDVRYDDNSDVLDAIEGQTGLLNLLNEECIRPKGNDFAYVQKLLRINSKSPALFAHRTDRLSFGVNHYAGKVMYDAEEFVLKNLDTLPTDLRECAELCSNSIVNTPTVATPSPHGHRYSSQRSNINAPTIWSKYKSQLADLMASLKLTKSRYIRCIKPNNAKKAGLMDHKTTVDQLRCAGVVAGITISRSCFPNRLPNSVVLARYSHHTDTQSFPSRKTTSMTLEERRAEDCKAVLAAALASKPTSEHDAVSANLFVVGKTKTYFKAGTLEFLESKRVKGLDNLAITIQRAARQWLVRNHGKHENSRQKVAEAQREAAQRALAEREAVLANERVQRRAQHNVEMQKKQDECKSLEREILAAEVRKLEVYQDAAKKRETGKVEVTKLREAVETLADENAQARRIEKIKQESAIEANNKMILYLKKENKKLRKEREKQRLKFDDASGVQEKLEDSTREFSESIDIAEELTLKEKVQLDATSDEYEAAKAFNKETKAKFRAQQNQYLDVATHRLSLQKALQKIIVIIDQHPGKPRGIAGEINLIVREVESLTKAEMKCVEAEFPTESTECSDTEFYQGRCQ